MKAIRI